MPNIESANVSPVVAADVFKPFGTADGGALRSAKRTKIIYDSGSVGAGAAIDSGVLDCSGADALMVMIVTGDATVRTLRVALYADDGTTLLTGPSNSRATAAGPVTEYVAYGPGGTATGNTAIVAWPLIPGRIKFDMAAAGASTCRIVIWAR